VGQFPVTSSRVFVKKADEASYIVYPIDYCRSLGRINDGAALGMFLTPTAIDAEVSFDLNLSSRARQFAENAAASVNKLHLLSTLTDRQLL
jgi:hypothetical protein